MTSGAPPAGYVSISAGGCTVVTLASLEDDARVLLANGTLYENAARDLAARPLQGRGIAYSIALPASGERVVVRHNRHGGLLAGITRDLFVAPTRAPYELDVSLRLRAASVPTPAVVMYGVYRAAGVFRRADVMTREISGGRDLSSYMSANENAETRAAAWTATRGLVRALNSAGARHHDLNVKNVLLSNAGGELAAHVLDVDRVTFAQSEAATVRYGNASRLLRSARKWRDEYGAVFDEREMSALGTLLDPAQ